jgi:hypothetical protein
MDQSILPPRRHEGPAFPFLHCGFLQPAINPGAGAMPIFENVDTPAGGDLIRQLCHQCNYGRTLKPSALGFYALVPSHKWKLRSLARILRNLASFRCCPFCQQMSPWWVVRVVMWATRHEQRKEAKRLKRFRACSRRLASHSTSGSLVL